MLDLKQFSDSMKYCNHLCLAFSEENLSFELKVFTQMQFVEKSGKKMFTKLSVWFCKIYNKAKRITEIAQLLSCDLSGQWDFSRAWTS